MDFRNLDAVVWDDALVFEDRRRQYGEPRLIAMTLVKDRLYVVVFVERDGNRRIISARKNNSREVAFYEKENPISNRGR